MIALGRAIASLRIERGFSRYDLVARTPISYPYIAEIEAGRKEPSYLMLCRLASALEVTAAQLLARGEAIAADPKNGVQK